MLFRKIVSAFLALAFFACAGFIQAAESPRPEVAKYVKAYTGTGGVKVWTVRIGPADNKEMLFQFGGIDHPMDLKIIKVKIEPGSAGKEKYMAEIDGKPYAILVLDGESYGELYLPGTNKSHSVFYSKSLSSESNSEYFLTDYLNQDQEKK